MRPSESSHVLPPLSLSRRNVRTADIAALCVALIALLLAAPIAVHQTVQRRALERARLEATLDTIDTEQRAALALLLPLQARVAELEAAAGFEAPLLLQPSKTGKASSRGPSSSYRAVPGGARRQEREYAAAVERLQKQRMAAQDVADGHLCQQHQERQLNGGTQGAVLQPADANAALGTQHSMAAGDSLCLRTELLSKIESVKKEAVAKFAASAAGESAGEQAHPKDRLAAKKDTSLQPKVPKFPFVVKWHAGREGVRRSRHFASEAEAERFFDEVGDLAKKILQYMTFQPGTQGTWVVYREYGGQNWLACMTNDDAVQVNACKTQD